MCWPMTYQYDQAKPQSAPEGPYMQGFAGYQTWWEMSGLLRRFVHPRDLMEGSEWKTPSPQPCITLQFSPTHPWENSKVHTGFELIARSPDLPVQTASGWRQTFSAFLVCIVSWKLIILKCSSLAYPINDSRWSASWPLSISRTSSKRVDPSPTISTIPSKRRPLCGVPKKMTAFVISSRLPLRCPLCLSLTIAFSQCQLLLILLYPMPGVNQGPPTAAVFFSLKASSSSTTMMLSPPLSTEHEIIQHTEIASVSTMLGILCTHICYDNTPKAMANKRYRSILLHRIQVSYAIRLRTRSSIVPWPLALPLPALLVTIQVPWKENCSYLASFSSLVYFLQKPTTIVRESMNTRLIQPWVIAKYHCPTFRSVLFKEVS